MNGQHPRAIPNGLAWTLTAHLALGVLYSLAIPMWEAYDEWGHYAYVRFVAEHLRLPRPEDVNFVEHDERGQPPLYYFIAGILTAWVEAPAEYHPVRNPMFSDDRSTGLNIAVHPDSENFPYRGVALALRSARLVSVLISTVGVWATYRLVLAWLPGERRVALLAATAHAFWPLYLFHGSVVTNDIMASVSGSLFAAALFVWLFQASTWKSGLALLAALVVLALSKFSVYGLVLFGVSALALSGLAKLYAQPQDRRRSIWPAIGALSALGLVVSYALFSPRPSVGPLGEGTLLGQRLASYLAAYANPAMYAQFDWAHLHQYLARGLRTFWALFAWGALEPPPWTYLAIGLVFLASAVGVLVQSWRSGRFRKGAALLGVLFLASVSAPLIRALAQKDPDLFFGRFYLSAMSPVVTFLAAGYSYLWPERLRTQAMIGLGLGLAALAASLPFTVILPAYARPDLLPPQAEAQITHPLDTRYGGAIRLAGYEVVTPAVHPGDTVEVGLYWQSIRPVEDNYILAIKLVDSNFAVLQEKYLFPGRGNFATSLWKPGDFFEETYALQLPASLDTPFRGQFLVGFLDENWQPALAPADAGGQPVGSWFGEFKVIDPSAAFQPMTVTSYRLGDQAALAGYTLHPVESSELKFDLYWVSLASLSADYTVSVALLGPEGEILAQADSQPRSGAYPTHMWEAGEKVLDPQALPLPAGIRCGAKTLYLGLYDPGAQFRLPVSEGNGVEIPDRAIKIPVTLDRSCVP